MGIVVLGYPGSYGVLRLTGTLTRYHYGLSRNPAEGRTAFTEYNEIRHRSYWTSKRNPGLEERNRRLHSVYSPLMGLELQLRGFGDYPRESPGH